jgi:hypothetical protein
MKYKNHVIVSIDAEKDQENSTSLQDKMLKN